MTDRIVPAVLPVFAALHVVVMTAPAAVLAAVADKGGLSALHGLDLLAASLAIGGAHAVIVWRRLRAELREGIAFRNASIAAFDALVVLAIMTTGLLYLVLGGFAPEHAAIVNHGWKVIWLWIGVLLASLAIAELTRTAVLRWLAADRRCTRSTRDR